MSKEMSDNARLAGSGMAAVAILSVGLAMSYQQSTADAPKLTASIANQHFLTAIEPAETSPPPPMPPTISKTPTVANSVADAKPEKTQPIAATQSSPTIASKPIETTFNPPIAPKPIKTTTVSYVKPIEAPKIEEAEAPKTTTPPEEISVPTSAASLETNPEDEVAASSVTQDEPTKPTAAKSVETKSDTAKSLPEESAALERPFLGVTFDSRSENLISTLYTDSTASKLGLASGDRLTSLNDQPVNDLASLRAALLGLSVGDQVQVTVARDDEIVALGPEPLGTKPVTK